ncbi:MAG TPA: DinB family protein [Chitinophagaceae bacterium]|nr:DinB family protein [Chitinophagaceae bacterium]
MTPIETAIKMTLDRWYGSVASLDKVLNVLTDEQLLKETAPGKNRGIYLLGHLVAVHDDMLTLLDLGEKQHPELTEPFIKLADNVATELPSVAVLRDYWSGQNALLREKFDQFTADQWFEKHTAVSAEDFAKEPHRNKLNIIISRTSHLQYHTGQIALLK